MVPAYRASQIESLRVEHLNARIRPSVFDIKCKNWTFKASIPDRFGEQVSIPASGTQFPLISNSATTSHKLQGATVENIFVNDWRYQSNWVYVVLSRVKTMNGLYIQTPLNTNPDKYRLPDKMKRMMKKFKDEKSIETLSEEVYEEILSSSSAASSVLRRTVHE